MAESTFMLEVVTPERILYRDEIQFMVAPGIEGELGIMKNHAPLVAALNIGVLRYQTSTGAAKRMAISGGFMEVIDKDRKSVV